MFNIAIGFIPYLINHKVLNIHVKGYWRNIGGGLCILCRSVHYYFVILLFFSIMYGRNWPFHSVYSVKARSRSRKSRQCRAPWNLRFVTFFSSSKYHQIEKVVDKRYVEYSDMFNIAIRFIPIGLVNDRFNTAIGLI
jgi:hypothetical protein